LRRYRNSRAATLWERLQPQGGLARASASAAAWAARPARAIREREFPVQSQALGSGPRVNHGGATLPGLISIRFEFSVSGFSYDAGRPPETKNEIPKTEN